MIGNGADPVAPGCRCRRASRTGEFALALGAITPRKQIAGAARHLRGG